MSYNYPFMISRHLNPRASGLIVLGGGSGDSYSAGGQVAGTPANEGRLDTFKSQVNSAASQAGGEGVDKIGQLGLAVQAVQAVAVPAFEGDDAASFVEKAEKYKASKVESLNTSLAEAQGQRSAEMASGAREMTSTAITDPTALATTADVETIDPNAAGTSITQGTGQVTGTAPSVTATTAGPASTAAVPTEISATGVTAATTGDAVGTAMEGVAPAQGEVSAEATMDAATADPTKTGVMDLKAAQGTATVLSNPVQREIQSGELI